MKINKVLDVFREAIIGWFQKGMTYCNSIFKSEKHIATSILNESTKDSSNEFSSDSPLTVTDIVNNQNEVAPATTESIDSELNAQLNSTGLAEILDAVEEEQASNVIPITTAKKPFPALEWSKLIRNAKDGGANSVLAANVLNKTSDLLKEADEVVVSMLDSGARIKKDVTLLNEFASEIKSISKHTKIVALNISIEAARAGEAGKTFKIVAEEMQNLSNKVNNLTLQIEKSLGEISERVKLNDNKCHEVAETFKDVHIEVSQFNNLMMRIEELATTQASGLNDFEKVLETEFDFSHKLTV